MFGADGMVFDDGVAIRLAEDQYLITTTTGGAAGVLDASRSGSRPSGPTCACTARA